jgi:arylsulfatase A-like enzyme
MNFQAVSVGQKLASDPAGATGYADVEGDPNPGLLNAIQFVDTSIGSMVTELQKQGINEDTLIIVTAKHGQSPIDVNKVNNTALSNGCNPPPTGCRLDDSLYATLVLPLTSGGLLTDDDVALLWLPAASQSQTASFV